MKNNEFVRGLNGKRSYISSYLQAQVGESLINNKQLQFRKKQSPEIGFFSSLDAFPAHAGKRCRLEPMKYYENLNTPTSFYEACFPLHPSTRRSKKDTSITKKVKTTHTKCEFLSQRHKMSLIYDSLVDFMVFTRADISSLESFLLIDAVNNFPSHLVVTALIYLERYTKNCKDISRTLDFYAKALISCIVIGSKFLEDHCLALEDVGSFFGFSSKTLFLVELNILSVLELNINVEEKEYRKAFDLCKENKV